MLKGLFKHHWCFTLHLSDVFDRFGRVVIGFKVAKAKFCVFGNTFDAEAFLVVGGNPN